MSLHLTAQAEKSFLIWQHYQNELVSDKYRTAAHKKIIQQHEEFYREEFLSHTEYMIPAIMEAAGARLIDGNIHF